MQRLRHDERLVAATGSRAANNPSLGQIRVGLLAQSTTAGAHTDRQHVCHKPRLAAVPWHFGNNWMNLISVKGGKKGR
jgi:hypothetical protein